MASDFVWVPQEGKRFSSQSWRRPPQLGFFLLHQLTQGGEGHGPFLAIPGLADSQKQPAGLLVADLRQLPLEVSLKM